MANPTHHLFSPGGFKAMGQQMYSPGGHGRNRMRQSSEHSWLQYWNTLHSRPPIKGGRGPTTWSRYRLSTGGLGNLIEVHGMISLCVLCRCCHGNWFGNLGLGIKKCQFLCDLVCVSRQVWYGVYIVKQYEEQFTIFSRKRMYTTYWDKGSLYFCGISVAHKIY